MIIKETMRLINEFLSRIEKHKNILFSNSATPFDYIIDAFNEWLLTIKSRIENNGNGNITELRKVIYRIGKEISTYVGQVRNKWLRIYRLELEKLVEELKEGKTTIIIAGEPFNEDKSFEVFLYTDYLTIEIERVAKSGSIVINIPLIGPGGLHIIVPKLFNDHMLKAMQYGLFMTDGSVDHEGYPVMNTNHLWQAITWLLTWPGNSHIYVYGISVNRNNVKVIWQLKAIDYKGKIGHKIEISKEILDFNDEEFMIFLLFAVLGDGSIKVKNERIMLGIGHLKHELWGEIIDRLKSYGFRDYDNKAAKIYQISGFKAVDLIWKWLSKSEIKTLIEDLSILHDAEKLRNLMVLANTKIKPLGRSSIEVVNNISMTVHILGKGFVRLIIHRHNPEDAKIILEKLQGAGYDAKLSTWGGRFVVYINQREIIKHPELVIKVYEILLKMLEEALHENNLKRAQKIIKIIKAINTKLDLKSISPK